HRGGRGMGRARCVMRRRRAGRDRGRYLCDDRGIDPALGRCVACTGAPGGPVRRLYWGARGAGAPLLATRPMAYGIRPPPPPPPLLLRQVCGVFGCAPSVTLICLVCPSRLTVKVTVSPGA